MFVKVVKELRDMKIDIVGIMAGSPVTKSDRLYKQQIEEYISHHHLEENVYIAGFRNDINNILAATDIVMIVSSEGLSLVALEAMAAKRKIISIASDGAYELLSQANCGSCYPADATPKEIAEFILCTNLGGTEREVELGYNFCRLHSFAKYHSELHRLIKGMTI